jgi:hypothetical protein
MSGHFLILFSLLLQAATGQTDPQVPQSPASVSTAESPTTPSVSTAPTTPEQLPEMIAAGEYVPLSQKDLSALQKLLTISKEPSAPTIRMARYEAEFRGRSLVSGTLQFGLSRSAEAASGNGLLLGRTSLRQLQLRDPQGTVPLGADPERRLFVLKPGLTGDLSGTWTADGLVSGESTIFRLELPASSATSLQLKTPPETEVTGLGCLVLGPQPAESGLLWELLASEPARLAFSCRNTSHLQPSEPLPLTSFSANHVLNGDIMSSRWTIGLPQNSRDLAALSARLSPGARVTAVRTDENRSVRWETHTSENSQSLLIRLSDAGSAGSLTISTASVIPDADKWDLPALAMQEWQSAQETRGTLLTPPGIVSVSLPSTVNIDDWALTGMQERDVVPGPDQSRTYQLTQYSSDASATVRTSTTAAVLSDAVATLLQPTGQLAAVRCFVNVQCREAAVIELKWPINAGWQIVAARYTSNGRALYFEQRSASGGEASDGSESSVLTVHLPETLEPDTSRVIDLQMQQSEKADPATLQPPLAVAPDVERTAAWLLYSPATLTGSRISSRWASGLQSMANQTFLAAAPWFPATEISEDTLCYFGGDSLPQMQPATQPARCRVTHQLRTDGDGVVVENLQVECSPSQLQSSIILRLDAEFAEEISWTVNGQTVTPTWRAVAGSENSWRDAILPLPQFRNDATVLINGSIRRAVTGQFSAAVPFLPEAETTTAIITLPRSDLKILNVTGLQESPAVPENAQLASWLLPIEPQTIVIQRSSPEARDPIQSADAACYHLIRERKGQVEHRMLAVIDVAGPVTANQLLIDTAQTQPYVLVEGRRIAAERGPTGLRIPLPATTDRCRVVLTWSPEFTPLENIRSRLNLSRLQSINGKGVQFVHHLLIAPELEPELPPSEFRVADSSDAPQLDELFFRNSPEPAHAANSAGFTSGPHAETTQFQLYWQLSGTRGWTRAWFVQPDTKDYPMSLEVTQKQRRRIVAAGMGVVFFGICLSCSTLLLRNPQAAALPIIMLSPAGLFELTPVVHAALQGAFWGSAGALLLMLSTRSFLRYLRSFRNTAILRSLTLLVTLTTHSATAQEAAQPPRSPLTENAQTPDILTPPPTPETAGIAFVRRSYLRQLRELELLLPKKSDAVVRSLKAIVTASTPDSVELRLELVVSVPSSDQPGALNLPTQGTQLVSCEVNGQQVFPEPNPPDQLAIPIPASKTVPDFPIADTDQNRTAVAADEVAAFSEHFVVCRLRPHTLRQPSGLQFRIPAPPSPLSEIEIIAAEGLFSIARLQSTDGFIQWNPASGSVPFNGLAGGDSVDVRLLQTELDRSRANPARVEVMTVAENTSGLQNLSCYCRFEQWNPLSTEIRYRIPDGFKLLSAAAAAGFQNPELLWSTDNQSAVIALPGVVPADFILHLQLRSTRPLPLQQQLIPVHQLNQFADCTPTLGGILALRANPIFAPVTPDRTLATPLNFTDVSPRWGPWLRRSDLIFQISQNSLSLQLTAPDRITTNEVRISQECTFTEQNMNWTCRMDVETSALAVFRHRITIPEKVIVQNVEVTAGEANRLASWHRRGNQVIILLREGTTGLHAITLQGTLEILPDDADLRIPSPTLEKSQILESSLVLNDQSGTGLVFADTGDAVSDPPLKPGDVLQRGSPLRLTVVGETRPIRLTRLNPVDPQGAVAAWWLADRLQFAVRLTQWSVALGPLEMNFPDNTEFVSEPAVLSNREKYALQRDGQRFFVDGTAIRSLFGQSDFTVIWSLPLPERKSATDSSNASIPWPAISERITWSELFLAEKSPARPTPESRMPDWTLDVGRLQMTASGARESEYAKRLPAGQFISPMNIQLPIPVVPTETDSGPGNSLVAISATVVSARPGQSPAAETEFLVFSRVSPFTCIVEIPDSVAVTELPKNVQATWEAPGRRRLVLSPDANLARFKLRWLARLTADQNRMSGLQLAVPFVRNSPLRQHLWIISPLREMPSVASNSPVLTGEQQLGLLKQDLRSGLSLLARHNTRNPEKHQWTTELLSDSLGKSVTEFMKRERHESGRRTVRLHKTTTDSISISFRRHLELNAIIPIGVGLFLMVLAVISGTGSSASPQNLTTVVTPHSLIQSTALNTTLPESPSVPTTPPSTAESGAPQDIRN